MTSTSSATHELALRLIALEASRAASQSAGPSDVERVLERMRLTLSRFAGVAGYRTVILRAVALGKVKTPSLKKVKRAAGRLFAEFR